MNKTLTGCLFTTVLWGLAADPVTSQGILTPLRVADLNPTGGMAPKGLLVVGTTPQQLLFSTRSETPGVQPKYGIWLSDGTAAGTFNRKEHNDLHTTIGATTTHIFYQRYVGLNSEDLYWQTIPPNIDQGLNTTFAMRNCVAEEALIFNGKLVVPATNTQSGDQELFSVEPSSGGGTVTMIKDIYPQGHSLPKGLCGHGGKIYFTATNSQGRELWVTDGTMAGTLMMKDIITGAVGSEPSDLASAAGRLYFTASVATGNREPWSCTGTTLGTVKLKEINPSTTAGSDPKEFTALGTKVFFTANNGTNGRELWVTDGTANGTVMVKDIITGSSGSEPHDLIAYNNKIWFVANDGLVATRSIWSSDGTAAGTVKVLSLPKGSDAENLNVCNSKLFYVTRDATTSKMWCTDGTTKGTKQVQPAISSNINPIGTTPMAVMGNWLYFSGNFDASGAELWKVQ